VIVFTTLSLRVSSTVIFIKVLSCELGFRVRL
jgi:hypothetical protein